MRHTRLCAACQANHLRWHFLSRARRERFSDTSRFLNCSGLAPISRARTLAAVKSLFGFCFRMRFVAVNYAAELPLPRYENRLAERVLSEENVHGLLAADTAQRDSILLKLLYLGGLRVSETISLRWRNLHSIGDAGQVTVFGKNGKTRAVALPAALWAELVALARGHGSRRARISVPRWKAPRPWASQSNPTACG